MKFCIQASNPQFQYPSNSIDECLSEAIETIFPLYTENAILTWNYISIPLSYKYDISYMIDDIIKLLQALQNNKNGVMEIHWLPDTFRCDWSVSWSDKQMSIISHWECTIGHLESILNKNNTIALPVQCFANEWKKVLENVLKGLTQCGYEKEKLRGMRELIDQYKSIEEFGVLYNEIDI